MDPASFSRARALRICAPRLRTTSMDEDMAKTREKYVALARRIRPGAILGGRQSNDKREASPPVLSRHPRVNRLVSMAVTLYEGAGDTTIVVPAPEFSYWVVLV
uniref:Uncharacterized protein n=1 Tax=Odontella aurita TaxID=265563 RepID=A0A7S4JHV2_9STRA